MQKLIRFARPSTFAVSRQVALPRATPLAQTLPMRVFSSEQHSDFDAKSKVSANTTESMNAQITKWIEENNVCLFMKGSRKMPQCGFSRFVVVLLNTYGVKNFKDVDVLSDDLLRSSIKEYSNWPTIPQVYIKGQFVGGCDIMKEMHEDGSLRELLIREDIIQE
jgi:monothiol glutaredoxin